MKTTYTFAAAMLLLFVIASPSLAVDPAPGTYFNGDAASSFPPGRGSQSHAQASNLQKGLDDVFNSASWDGAGLGTQWTHSCGVAPAIQVRTDMRDASDTGIVRFENTFQGGTFFLWKDGPWGDTVNDLTGTVGTTVSVIDVQYVNGIPAFSVGNVQSSGQFDGSLCILTFTIGNLAGVGQIPLPFPADYPALIDPDCDDTRVFGSWGDVVTLAMRIDCPVQTLDNTWGGVKAIYR